MIHKLNETMHRCILCKFLIFINLLTNTFRRDLTFFVKLIFVKIFLVKDYLLNLNVCAQFAANVRKYPKKWAFISEDSRWSFQDVDQYSNRVANFFNSEGLKPGDEVAVLMQSTPEEVMIILGLAKIGVVTAVINDNLRLDCLVHAISCIDAKAIIFDPEYKTAICEIQQSLSQKLPNTKYYMLGGTVGCEIKVTDLKAKIETELCQTLSTKHQIKYTDKFCYIYTSGTTGLPKASIIRHSRFNFGIKMRNMFVGVKSNDILYNSLPLYHVMGLVFGPGSALLTGQTVIMRKSFSASNFWKDCLRYQCTVASYIGETSRYLLEQPVNDRDREHKVRRVYGIGMRETVFKKFRDRFGIDYIYEFYASTEGNVTLVNFDNKEGSCGFIPIIIPEFIRKRLFPIALVRVNEETGELQREINKDISCQPGESGMLAGRIYHNNPISSFDGYVDKEETEKKIVRDVFVQGDRYFMTGDLFTMDSYGYLYFKDRLGDTFKWKGENVSTTEVEGLISKELNEVDCVVYGVEVPNHEGRAGMAAIKNLSLDINCVYTKFFKVLPYYAVPVFIRLVKSVDMTGTHKYKKTELRKEGFNISVVNDPLYVFDLKTKTYIKIDAQIYDDIINNRIHF